MKKHGFTLIEIMIVIAIIVILFALFLPVAKGAIDQSRKVKCMNNLHQLGNALRMYQNDHDQLLPMGASQEGPSASPTSWSHSWHDSLASYAQGKAEVFRCPLVSPSLGYRYSYGANPWRFGFKANPLEGFSTTYDSVLLAEKANSDWAFYPRSYYDDPPHTYLTARHQGGERTLILLESDAVIAVRPEELGVVKTPQ